MSNEVRKRIHRFEIDIDRQPHTFMLPEFTPILRAEQCYIKNMRVEFWIEISDTDRITQRTFIVYQAGDEIPLGHVWCYTTARTVVDDVWHLYEISCSCMIKLPNQPHNKLCALAAIQ